MAHSSQNLESVNEPGTSEAESGVVQNQHGHQQKVLCGQMWVYAQKRKVLNTNALKGIAHEFVLRSKHMRKRERETGRERRKQEVDKLPYGRYQNLDNHHHQ